ncbi:hypothetical protein ACQE8V_28150, partial [Klebsiella pneumoniae]
MGSCAAPSAKGDDKFITTDYLQQCPEDHGAYRYRRTMDNNFRLVNVYITDMKITEIPQK